MLWSERTWAELPNDLEAAGHAAILPVGATEQHGPHMGTGMDAVLADLLCKAVSERTKVPMLPTMFYGCSIGHSRRWPGTIALQPITLINLIKDIGDWAYHSGVRRLFMVNTHVTNAAPLRCALEMLRAEHDDMMVALVNSATVSKRVREFHFADGDDVQMKADDPDRTDGLVFAHPVNRTSLNGVTGTPSRATAENGNVWFDWMVEDLSALILKGLKENPPLEHSYFESSG